MSKRRKKSTENKTSSIFSGPNSMMGNLLGGSRKAEDVETKPADEAAKSAPTAEEEAKTTTATDSTPAVKPKAGDTASASAEVKPDKHEPVDAKPAKVETNTATSDITGSGTEDAGHTADGNMRAANAETAKPQSGDVTTGAATDPTKSAPKADRAAPQIETPPMVIKAVREAAAKRPRVYADELPSTVRVGGAEPVLAPIDMEPLLSDTGLASGPSSAGAAPTPSKGSAKTTPDARTAPEAARGARTTPQFTQATKVSPQFAQEASPAVDNVRMAQVAEMENPPQDAVPTGILTTFTHGQSGAEYYAMPFDHACKVADYATEVELICQEFARLCRTNPEFLVRAESYGIKYVRPTRQCTVVFVNRENGTVYTDTRHVVPGCVAELRPIDPDSGEILLDEKPTLMEVQEWYGLDA